MAEDPVVNAQRDAEEQERWRERQLRLLAVNQKLEALGLDLDGLIELIEARQDGSY